MITKRVGTSSYEYDLRTLAVFLELDKHIPYETGYMLKGINIKVKEHSWLMVVRVEGKNGRSLVTFIESNSLAHCIDLLVTALRSNSIRLKWHRDKWGG